MKQPITIVLLNNEIALDKICWNCRGVNLREHNESLWEDGVCSICKGKGYEPTDAGQAIIGLVKRHLG